MAIMTTHPKDLMTLEETLQVLREDVAICDQNIRICDENLYDEEAALLRKHRGAYQSALHHLEVLKQDTARLDYIQDSGHHLEKFEGLWLVVTDTEHGCIGDEQYVRNAIDAAIQKAPNHE